MGAQRLLGDVPALKALAELLSRCPEVTRLDEGEDKEAWTLAYTFGDLEGSFRAFLEDQLPRLVKEQLQASEIFDLLLDIGEEFRHILYHIKDPKFYSHLHDENDDELEISERWKRKKREREVSRAYVSLDKSLHSLKRRLAEHREKLSQIRAAVRPTGLTEREIVNVGEQIDAIENVLGT